MPEYETQNEIKLLAKGRTSEIYTHAQGRVLKLYLHDWPAEAIEQETHVLRIVNGLEIPSPHVYETIKVGDRTGLILEELRGESLTSELKKRPFSLIQRIKEASKLQAEINSKSTRELPSQREVLVKEISAASIPDSLRSKVLSLLNSLPDDDKVCHGDYHVDNLFVTDKGLVVLDWAAATRGNPLADLARTMLLLRIGAPPDHAPALDRALLKAGRAILPLDKLYLKEYSRHAAISEDQLKSWVIISAAARLSENYPEERDGLLAITSG